MDLTGIILQERLQKITISKYLPQKIKTMYNTENNIFTLQN